ncbi:MAG: hypothetical protein ISN28_15885 [Ectothiorhodospiraceae bacterium AqS1]|nr:hypothetical protein [Ectothiorhodospiraceae bacterium AqS1]
MSDEVGMKNIAFKKIAEWWSVGRAGFLSLIFFGCTVGIFGLFIGGAVAIGFYVAKIQANESSIYRLQSDMSAVRDEQVKIRYEVESLRDEFGIVRSEFGLVRSEFGAVRSEFGVVRSEFGELRAEFDGLSSELRSDVGKLQGGMNEVLEALRDLKAEE